LTTLPSRGHPAQLHRREVAHAAAVSGMCGFAAKLADRTLYPGDADDIARASQTAHEWAHGLLQRIGGHTDDGPPPTAREYGEINDPRVVLRQQMLENRNRRRPRLPA
jgi:hypothetical protein